MSHATLLIVAAFVAVWGIAGFACVLMSAFSR